MALYQLLVAGSGFLAGLPVGASVGFPSVLLHQLSLNESTIHLDWDTASWIGSIHGLAAIPSILMPVLMQWKGRKLAFILACLVSIIGWIVAFTATNVTSILVSECLHGFGSQSIMTVGLLSMNEMLPPSIRSVLMGLYFLMQTTGMALVLIIGNHLYWKTLTLVACAPLIILALAVCAWPESPHWLAYKGQFNKCAKSFVLLRGNGELAQAELEELILAQKENLARVDKSEPFLKYFWLTLTSRDFYLPIIHILVSLYSAYSIGGLAVMIYLSDIIQRATNSKDAVIFGNTLFNIVLPIGCILGLVFVRHFQPKVVCFVSFLCSIVSLLSASGVSYSQNTGMLSKESNTCLYILVFYMFVTVIRNSILPIITCDLIPVKHRGIGGPLYSIITCLLHTSVLKSTPYLLRHINLWGTLLFFAVNGFVTGVFVWVFVPETKGKTLQQLEDYYNYGNMNKRRVNDLKDLPELMPINE